MSLIESWTGHDYLCFLSFTLLWYTCCSVWTCIATLKEVNIQHFVFQHYLQIRGFSSTKRLCHFGPSLFGTVCLFPGFKTWKDSNGLCSFRWIPLPSGLIPMTNTSTRHLWTAVFFPVTNSFLQGTDGTFPCVFNRGPPCHRGTGPGAQWHMCH